MSWQILLWTIRNKYQDVCTAFQCINTILPQINRNRKRIVSIKYLIYKLFKLWGFDYKIKINESKKTLQYYESYWNDICQLLGDNLSYIFYYIFSLFCLE